MLMYLAAALALEFAAALIAVLILAVFESTALVAGSRALLALNYSIIAVLLDGVVVLNVNKENWEVFATTA
jgi:hypothetical protein